MVRSEAAGSICCVSRVAPGWGISSSLYSCHVLAELPSLNLSSVACLTGFLG